MGSCLVLASPDDGWEDGQLKPVHPPHQGRGAHPSTKGGMPPLFAPQPKAASDTDIGSTNGGLGSHRNRKGSRSASVGQGPSPFFPPDQQPLDLADPRLAEVLSFKLKGVDHSAAPKPGKLQPQTPAARSRSNSFSVGSPRPAPADSPRDADSPLRADLPPAQGQHHQHHHHHHHHRQQHKRSQSQDQSTWHLSVPLPDSPLTSWVADASTQIQDQVQGSKNESSSPTSVKEASDTSNISAQHSEQITPSWVSHSPMFGAARGMVDQSPRHLLHSLSLSRVTRVAEEDEDEDTSNSANTHHDHVAARHRDRLAPSSHALTSSNVLSRNQVNVEGRPSPSPAPTLSWSSSLQCTSIPPSIGPFGASAPPSRSGARQGDLTLAQQIMQRNAMAATTGGSPVVSGVSVPLTSSGELPSYLANLPRVGTASRPGSRAGHGPGPRPFSRSYQSPLSGPHVRRTSDIPMAPLTLPPPAFVLC